MKIDLQFLLIKRLLLFFGLFFTIVSCSEGESESEPIVVKTGTVIDIDQNVYKTVKIGSQWWMAENLKTSKYNDGTEIPYVELYQTTSVNSEAYYWYNNDYAEYGSIYGPLYNFYAVDMGKLCPKGWHIPSPDEWDKLVESIGLYVAIRLKEPGTEHWWEHEIYNAGSPEDNATGFTALPSGIAIPYIQGENSGSSRFSHLGKQAAWWTSEQINSKGIFRRLSHLSGDLTGTSRDAHIGQSCRCVKD